jgi:hypothetical protein
VVASSVFPAIVGGLPTVILPASGAPYGAANPLPRIASMNQALAVKQRHAAALLRLSPAVFGVGVGQSLDNPADAALMLFVDRKKTAGRLPESIEGVRVRTILMDRLHVTRSHGTPELGSGLCPTSLEPKPEFRPFEDKLELPN